MFYFLRMILNELKVLTAKNLLDYVSEEDIYRFYLSKDFKFDVPFSSPFRDDKRPSFIIGGRSRSYKYKDFTTGDSGNCFIFVMKLFGIDFNKCLIQIATDFHVRSHFNIAEANFVYQAKKAEYKNALTNYEGRVNVGETSLEIKKREFASYDFEYWNTFGVSAKYLKLGRIVAISHYFINGVMYLAEKYAYAFIENKDGIVTYKVYQPLSLYKKWINNNNFSIIELWHLLPEKHDKLVITSSRKDALSIIENCNIPAISYQAESIMPKENVLRELLSRFKTVYLLYDNDYDKSENWGQKMASKLVERYPDLKNIVIDEKYLSKDFSDLVKNHGRSNSSLILKKMTDE